MVLSPGAGRASAGGCILCHLSALPSPFILPPSPRPALAERSSPPGKGETLGYFMQGAPPLASPALDRLRYLQNLPSRCQAGGLPSLLPACPAFSLLSCPLSPLPRWGRGRFFSFLMQGAPPLASPALDRLRHLQSLPSGCPQGELLPLRHLLALPRGRGPSQTPPSLATDSSISPGPPSPWLPALFTSTAS